MIARFTAERMRGTGKTSIFNLGDDLNLTHGGADIDSIDRFEDPKSDDEEEEELLGKQFVDSAHFGGFMSQVPYNFPMIAGFNFNSCFRLMMNSKLGKETLGKSSLRT